MALNPYLPWTRPPAVAGLFYPQDRDTLVRDVKQYIAAANQNTDEDDRPTREAKPPKAIIGPHAGFVYSGPVAGTVYARLGELRGVVSRVILIGPSHRVAFSGIAVSTAEAFATPMGDVPIDQAAAEQAVKLPEVRTLDKAHDQEHGLEVHLPFLIDVLGAGSFAIVPMVYGDVSADAVAAVLATLWGGPETLIVISSDLSHYHDYDTANAMDRATSEAIEALSPEAISHDQACGRVAIQGLLLEARKHGLTAQTLDQRNSGDTGGKALGEKGRARVVGYGAYLLN